jgi:hypothetical protein
MHNRFKNVSQQEAMDLITEKEVGEVTKITRNDP